MTQNYPTLHQLNIYRVASRHLSFQRAADELCITPSAVSHQIKKLEEQLGFKLFVRLNRALTLTDNGDAFLTVADDTLSCLISGIEHIRRQRAPQALRISLMPSLASQIVIPKLADFHQQHPNADIRIEAGMHNVDFQHDDVDLAIRFGDGLWPGVHTEIFATLSTAMVCSPKFAEQHNMKVLANLNTLPMINMPTAESYLVEWVQALGFDAFKPTKTLWFNAYHDCIHAAEQGLGLALALLPLENELLANQRLVAPFDFVLDHSQRYEHYLYKVCRPGEEQRDDIRQFCDWLQATLLAL